MASISQTPGTLDLSFNKGDEVAFEINFNPMVSGYTYNANIVKRYTLVEVPFVIVPTVSGIWLGLDEVTSDSLPVGEHSWYLKWTTLDDVTRTILIGSVEIT